MQLQIAGQIEDSAQTFLALLQKHHQVGTGNSLDVAQAQAGLGIFLDNTLRIRLAHTHAQRALELLPGRYPAALY